MRPLILVHGTRLHRGQWRDYPELLPGVDITLLDLPGHGARTDSRFTGEDALAVIDEAVVDSRARTGQAPVLAGHSLGGYLSAIRAARHSDDLAGLVMIGATAAPQWPLTVPYQAFSWFSTRTDPQRLAARMNWLARRLGVAPDIVESLNDGTSYAALPAAWRFVMDEVTPEILREVRCPVWLVNGQYDQMRVHVQQFAAAAHRSRVVTVPRATHLAPLTHPDEVAVVLREAVADNCD